MWRQTVTATVTVLIAACFSATSVAAGNAPPAAPPARICGSPSLDGPAAPPAGSVTVHPGQHLGELTRASRRGTTFWLAPGRHVLGSDRFDQVIPKAGNEYVGAPGAVLDGRRLNAYAFTQHARRVTIRHLTIENFIAPLNEGVVNHDAGPRWRIEHNTIRNNDGAGVFLGPNGVVRHNCLTANGQYGFQGFHRNITLTHNEISLNNTQDVEDRIPGGCGCSGGGKFWGVTGATVTDNWVHHNRGPGLWADTNNAVFRFEGNYIEDNDGQAIFYETSYNFLIANNTIVRNTWVTGREFSARGDSFPVGTIYISESGGDERVSRRYARSRIVGNLFKDNWGGVVLWENADRFCNSAANTSTGLCTRGGRATLKRCSPPRIDTEPYYSDCRWKTQNVAVHANRFLLDPVAVDGCDPTYCGKQGLFSNFGTFPRWSPYKGMRIARAVTFRRNNRFHHNTYIGPWSFAPYDGSPVNFERWRRPPYRQDAGSTMRR